MQPKMCSPGAVCSDSVVANGKVQNFCVYLFALNFQRFGFTALLYLPIVYRLFTELSESFEHCEIVVAFEI